MGKYGPRLKGKGRRWKKGHSSSSNPETRKNRDAAKSQFLRENLGTSKLTADAIKKHNALMGVKPEEEEGIEMDEVTASQGQTFRTFQTFASDWSSCSNVSFSQFLTKFTSNSAIHKEMLAVLAAVTEVIKANGGTESTTEYFAALMTTLSVTESEESLAAVLSLLGMGIKNVPKAVLQRKFGESTQVLMDILTRFHNSDNPHINRATIGCLSVLLRSQESAAWKDSSTIQVLDSILAFTIHTKPKTRKAAQHAVAVILKSGSEQGHHPAAGHVGKYCASCIENSAVSTSSLTTLLHVLTLLKEVIATIPKQQLKVVCEAVLKVMTLNNALVLSCGMQALHSLFVARPPPSVLPSSLNSQLIAALYEYQPAPNDTQPTLAWVAVMQEAHLNLAKIDIVASCGLVARLFDTLSQLWLTDKPEVLAGVTHALGAIVTDCVGPASADPSHRHFEVVSYVFKVAQSGLQYQYHSAWKYILHLFGVLFEACGPHCESLVAPCIKTLGELRDSAQYSLTGELDNAISKAIKAMGPKAVMKVIPLETGDDLSQPVRRSWVLPILRESVAKAPLSFFIEYFMPLAMAYRRRSEDLKAKQSNVGAVSFDLLQSQVWALLPSFCNHPPDVKDCFKNIAKNLGAAISDKKDLRLSVMASLRKLITGVKENTDSPTHEADLKELARFAKNFLPILFNLYATPAATSDEEGQRLAAFETIKVYLSITDEKLRVEFFERAFSKIESNQEDEANFENILDLLRAMLVYQEESNVKRVYDLCVEHITSEKKAKCQKKAFRCLEDICSSEGEGCCKFTENHLDEIQTLLIQSLSTSATTSRGPRLRCLIRIVKRLTEPRVDLLKEIVPEAILCCKDVNERCRLAAFALLHEVGLAMVRWYQQEHDDKQATYGGKDMVMREFLSLVLPGLAGSPRMVNASLLALADITHHFREEFPGDLVQLLLDNVCVLAISPTREVCGGALSYLKQFLQSFPSEVVGPFLPLIVKTFVNMNDDCKRHFRNVTRDMLARLIRKFGSDAVENLVPKSDETMLKRLRNMRKADSRKKRLREEKRARKAEADDDSDAEEEFVVKARAKSIEEILADSDDDVPMDAAEKAAPGKAKRKAKEQTWIQEQPGDIVDLADAFAVSSISATKPGTSSQVQPKPKKKDHGFKTTPEGKLIIADDSSDSDEDNKPKRKRNAVTSDSDDSGDDDDSLDEKSTAAPKSGGRKRKLSIGTDGASSIGPKSKYKTGGKGIHRPMDDARSVKSDYSQGARSAASTVTVGQQFKAKKAKGDMKKKGQPDPYAYLPLRRSALNKRKQHKVNGQFKSLVRGAKKGAASGRISKARRLRK